VKALRLALAGTIAVVAGATAAAVHSASAAKPGAPCPQKDHAAKFGKLTLVCEPNAKGKLVWLLPKAGGGNTNGGNNGGANNGGTGNTGGSGNGTQFCSSLKLEGFQLRVGRFDPSTGKAGDLVFSKAGLQPQVGVDSIFLEFGHKVSGSQTKDLPHFTFYALLGTQVISPNDGVVVFIDNKAGGQDQSVTIAPSTNSHCGVNLDHVTGVTVKPGDTVHAGDVIGTVGIPIGTAPGWGANELSVKDGLDQDAGALFLCPWKVWDPAKIAAAQGTTTQLMSDWETFVSDQTVYDQAAMVSPGCDMQSEPVH
jgi:murein DD-endopeptidase MepM/ murein hydrolase activator NlpD